VEHRHRCHDRVHSGQSEKIGQRAGDRMKVVRPMRVHDALWMARSSAGIAQTQR
jgi:hypothetical protein